MPRPSNSMTPPRATVLVAEDDGPSGLFLQTALEDMGCRAVVEADGCAALMHAREYRFDLLVLDFFMPGAGALRILAALRTEAAAASRATPAIATSAELDTTRQRQLRQAGFIGMLPKPLTLASLHGIVEPLLPEPNLASNPLLDDAMAVHTSGTPDAVNALRALFAQDLRRLANDLDTLARDPHELHAHLHRLLASCGFCGTPALADASRRLKQCTGDDRAPPAGELEHFRATLMHTLQALGV